MVPHTLTKSFKIYCKKHSICNFPPFPHVSPQPFSFIDLWFYFISWLIETLILLRSSSEPWSFKLVPLKKLIGDHWIVWRKRVHHRLDGRKLKWLRLDTSLHLIFQILHESSKFLFSSLLHVIIFSFHLAFQVFHIIRYFFYTPVSIFFIFSCDQPLILHTFHLNTSIWQNLTFFEKIGMKRFESIYVFSRFISNKRVVSFIVVLNGFRIHSILNAIFLSDIEIAH